MHQQPPVVTFEMVEKRFGARPLILDRVSFSAACGDFIALIGPSGCGKSTILKLISGLIPHTSGRIIIDGMEPEHAAEELAYVFQEPTLMPWLTVQWIAAFQPRKRLSRCAKAIHRSPILSAHPGAA